MLLSLLSIEAKTTVCHFVRVTMGFRNLTQKHLDEHRWVPEWDLTLPLRLVEASLTRGDTIWRRITAASIRTLFFFHSVKEVNLKIRNGTVTFFCYTCSAEILSLSFGSKSNYSNAHPTNICCSLLSRWSFSIIPFKPVFSKIHHYWFEYMPYCKIQWFILQRLTW